MNKQILSTREDFEYWLASIDSFIDLFMQALPAENKKSMNFSIDSLNILEDWMLNTYSSTEEILEPSQINLLTGIYCYLGETFRKNIGGRWSIELENRDFLFFGLPIITGFPNELLPICPLTLSTACVDRRNGTFLRKVIKSLIKRQEV